MRLGVALAAVSLVACGEAGAPRPVAARPEEPRAAAPEYATQDGAWGRFHSKRFQLSLPLPDGRAWKIDDHRAPELVAVHPPTSSRLVLVTTQEDELVNRQRCEDRARALGWLPGAGRSKVELTTVDDQVWVGPEAYDSRLWTALEVGSGAPGTVTGHVYLFGAFLRRCLLVHLSTSVPSSKDESVLASRLALANARLFKGIALDPMRTTVDATVPREKPEIRR